MGQLAKIDPIPLPDPRKPTRMPSLPGWLATRKDAAVKNLQPIPGKRGFQDVWTLPPGMQLTDHQRGLIEDHFRSLHLLLGQTPENSAEYEQKTLIAVTKLLLVLPGQKTTEMGAEAKAEAYAAALDDVPYWAVESAIRRWYRGECGNDNGGRPYDYRWSPDPATLRSLAQVEKWRVKGRMEELRPVLVAVEYVDTTKDLERGRAAVRGLFVAMAAPGGLAERPAPLTFDDAIALGSAKVPAKSEAGDGRSQS